MVIHTPRRVKRLFLKTASSFSHRNIQNGERNSTNKLPGSVKKRLRKKSESFYKILYAGCKICFTPNQMQNQTINFYNSKLITLIFFSNFSPILLLFLEIYGKNFPPCYIINVPISMFLIGTKFCRLLRLSY